MKCPFILSKESLQILAIDITLKHNFLGKGIILNGWEICDDI